MDGTIPRANLPQVLAAMKVMSEKYALRCANVFHAGDGNLHPLILYDANIPGELDRAEQFVAEILKLCVKVGGVLTGQHGVGIEKRDLMGEMFSELDLAAQQRVKCAFDDKGLLNPGKVFPVLRSCAELGRMQRPLLWIASSKRDYMGFPPQVQDGFGFELFLVQTGQHPPSAKPLKGLGRGTL